MIDTHGRPLNPAERNLQAAEQVRDAFLEGAYLMNKVGHRTREDVASAIFLAAYALLRLREVDRDDRALDLVIAQLRQEQKRRSIE